MKKFKNKMNLSYIILIKALLVTNSLVYPLFSLLILKIFKEISVILGVVFAISFSLVGIFVPLMIIMKGLNNHFIRFVIIGKKGFFLIYRNSKKNFFFPYENVKKIVKIDKYFLILTTTEYRHTRFFKKGVICSGWLDNGINENLIQILDKYGKKIVVINEEKYNDLLYRK